MEKEYKSYLKNWKQYFSESKKRSYYFNSKTGESLWTFEEVEQRIKQLIKNSQATSSSIIDDVVMSDLPENDDKCDPMDIEIATDIHNLRNDFIMKETEFENFTQPISRTFFLDSEFELILILDTNIFISNLEQLKELSTKNSSKIVFFVPWVVVQELDNLKNKKYKEKHIFISQKAQEAIKFIHYLLDTKKTSFCFENFCKSNILIDGCIPQNNDDRILNSALRISKENPNKRCVMVTNDLNLINKSKICNFEALNFKNLKSSLDNEKIDHANLFQNSLCTQDKEPFCDPMLDQFNFCIAHIIEDRLINSSTTVLSMFFEFEMKRIYDDLWLDLLLHKPPWTLATLIVSLNKVFNAMFCFTESSRSYEYNNEFQKLKYSIENYNKILLSNKINYLRDFKNMTCSLEVAQCTLNLLKSIESSNADSSFIFQMKILNNYLIVGHKIFEILQFSKTKLVYFDNERETHHISDNLHHIETIWEKFKNFSFLEIECFQNIDTKLNIQNDVCFNIHYSISHESLRYLIQFYENCMKDCNKDSLRRFSIVIYILYKIFQINMQSNIETQGDYDLNEYLIILFSLKNFFTNMDFREKMNNVFWQFKEFENRFNTIEHDDFINILKFEK